ncbi:MAG: NAD-dependent epimerase/dehydratase family protein [Planctomycetota bacterium]
MRVFITGATGFIGRRLVDRLLSQGHDVTALIRKDTQELPRRVERIRGTLDNDIPTLARVMRGHDVVFHLAAMVSFDTSALGDLLRVNGEGTRKILAAAREALVPRSVLVSSACTLGLSRTGETPLDESAVASEALIRRNPYLRSKLLAEGHAKEAVHAGQSVVIVNPTTVFGSGDKSLNAGTMVRQVARSRVIPVPPGGSNVADIDDVVDGMILAALRGRKGARYVLGGVNLTFREIIDRIAEVVGRRPMLVSVHSLARRPMMAAAWMVGRLTNSRLITPQIIADTFAYKFYSSRRAEVELGWKARRDFTTTLSDAWDYYQREGLIIGPTGAIA